MAATPGPLEREQRRARRLAQRAPVEVLAGIAVDGKALRGSVTVGGATVVVAHALLAMVNELALMIARADRPVDALADVESALHELLDRVLRADPAGPR